MLWVWLTYQVGIGLVRIGRLGIGLVRTGRLGIGLVRTDQIRYWFG